MLTVPLTIRNPASESGIRPFEITRDLRQVADLVSEAFAGELDEASTSALRELQIFGNLARILRLGYLNSFSTYSPFDGFVWMEMSRVVGNISLQRMDPYGRRWQVANIAVARSHQRQGIGRKLLAHAIAYLKEMGAQYAVLQVRSNNHIALDLYAKHGFTRMGGTTELKGFSPLAHTLAPSPEDIVADIPVPEWRRIYDLARSQVEYHTQWWHPLRKGEFVSDWPQRMGERFSAFMGRSHIHRLGIRTNAGHYATAALVRSHGWRRQHDISWWTRSQRYGHYETAMAAAIAQAVGDQPGFRIRAQIDADHAEGIQALQDIGLREATTLDTMRCVLVHTGKNTSTRFR